MFTTGQWGNYFNILEVCTKMFLFWQEIPQQVETLVTVGKNKKPAYKYKIRRLGRKIPTIEQNFQENAILTTPSSTQHSPPKKRFQTVSTISSWGEIKFYAGLSTLCVRLFCSLSSIIFLPVLDYFMARIAKRLSVCIIFTRV